ncbi:MAG: hypothetical protein J7K31_00150 [Candidatus Aenigmarchaeota archaeon]|nr:hypothetical protein [Candidatus Aenigmarchaeota archaeon]
MEIGTHNKAYENGPNLDSDSTEIINKVLSTNKTNPFEYISQLKNYSEFFENKNEKELLKERLPEIVGYNNVYEEITDRTTAALALIKDAIAIKDYDALKSFSKEFGISYEKLLKLGENMDEIEKTVRRYIRGLVKEELSEAREKVRNESALLKRLEDPAYEAELMKYPAYQWGKLLKELEDGVNKGYIKTDDYGRYILEHNGEPFALVDPEYGIITDKPNKIFGWDPTYDRLGNYAVPTKQYLIDVDREVEIPDYIIEDVKKDSELKEVKTIRDLLKLRPKIAKKLGIYGEKHIDPKKLESFIYLSGKKSSLWKKIASVLIPAAFVTAGLGCLNGPKETNPTTTPQVTTAPPTDTTPPTSAAPTTPVKTPSTTPHVTTTVPPTTTPAPDYVGPYLDVLGLPRTPETEKEINEYLIEKNISPEDVGKVLKELSNYGFVSDKEVHDWITDERLTIPEIANMYELIEDGASTDVALFLGEYNDWIKKLPNYEEVLKTLNNLDPRDKKYLFIHPMTEGRVEAADVFSDWCNGQYGRYVTNKENITEFSALSIIYYLPASEGPKKKILSRMEENFKQYPKDRLDMVAKDRRALFFLLYNMHPTQLNFGFDIDNQTESIIYPETIEKAQDAGKIVDLNPDNLTDDELGRIFYYVATTVNGGRELRGDAKKLDKAFDLFLKREEDFGDCQVDSAIFSNIINNSIPFDGEGNSIAITTLNYEKLTERFAPRDHASPLILKEDKNGDINCYVPWYDKHKKKIILVRAKFSGSYRFISPYLLLIEYGTDEYGKPMPIVHQYIKGSRTELIKLPEVDIDSEGLVNEIFKSGEKLIRAWD